MKEEQNRMSRHCIIHKFILDYHINKKYRGVYKPSSVLILNQDKAKNKDCSLFWQLLSALIFMGAGSRPYGLHNRRQIFES